MIFDNSEQATAREVNCRLLDAAEAVFAEKGFEAASIREITGSAGCNVAAVNYHFGSKENLYREVFRRRFGQLRQVRLEAIDRVMGSTSPLPSLEGLCEAFARAFVEPLMNREDNQVLMRLFSREMQDHRLGMEMLLEEVILPVRERFCAALEVLCPGMGRDDAILCVHCFVGQLLHLAHMMEFVADLQVLGLEDNRFERALKHSVRFTAAGIRAFCGGPSGGETASGGQGR